MTLEANVLGADALRSTPTGYEVDVGLAWYRSLPLSCVENVSIAINGRDVPREDIRVLYEGSALTFDDLAERVEDWWFIQDRLTLQVSDPAPLQEGSKAELEVELATRIPYIIIGPDTALVQRTRAKQEVTVQ